MAQQESIDRLTTDSPVSKSSLLANPPTPLLHPYDILPAPPKDAMTVREKRPTLTLPDPHWHSESLKPKSPSPRATPPRHDSNDTGRAQSSTGRDRHAEKSHHPHHSNTRSKTKVDEPRSKHDGGESRRRREPAEVRPTDSKKGLEQRESCPRQESSESKSKRLQ